ncbi:macrosialin [Zootoca vivipara]|uniref:macrosialin n=1 Tax=Zootoca vivipara TaxID=8524 RepID=UPI00293B9D14|nr:macrosialin [Zootoca vivipara]
MGLAAMSSIWLIGCFFLAAYSSAQYTGTSRPATKETGFLEYPLCSGTDATNPGCPHRKKSVTLLPSFTKTTETTTQRPPTKHHAVTNHTTAHPTKHATARPTKHATARPTKHTTAHPTKHTTPHPTKHSTPHPTKHSTPHPTKHTTAHSKNHTVPHPTLHPRNRTTPHPAPTRQPTQPPVVSVGDYVVPKGSDPCLRVQAALQLRVRYTDKAKQELWGSFAVNPNRTEFSGNCTNQTAVLHLHFLEGDLLFTFRKNYTRNTFYLSRVQASLTYQFHQAAGQTFRADNSSLREFEARLGHSYQCRNRTLVLAEGFHLSALQERVQAFDLQDGKFGEAEVCPEQRRTLLVPIIIGVLLLVLILIVVVAFLIGRARTHRGYQTI